MMRVMRTPPSVIEVIGPQRGRRHVPRLSTRQQDGKYFELLDILDSPFQLHFHTEFTSSSLWNNRLGIMSALSTNFPYRLYSRTATMSDFCRYCNYSSVGEYLCDPMAPDICAPCQHLLKLEAKIKEMRAALVGLEEERRQMREQVNHSHDRLIHRFPPEITAYIFELSLPKDVMDIDIKDRPSRYTMSAPFILSAVCRRWRAIAQSTPRLWKSLPLYISDSSYMRHAMPVNLVNQWIDCAGELPLSINLHVPNDAPRCATQIMNALNQRANRLIRLKYEGISSFLPYFSEDLPQLQTLDLTNFDERNIIKRCFKPRPTQLNALSISANMLVAVDFDWQHLTHLVLLGYRSLSECFEALRKAPCLMRCTFRVHRDTRNLVIDNSSLPQNRILQPKLQYLEITDTSVACDAVLSQLLCPNLSTLVLEGFASRKPFDIPTIIELLQRSECPLERLSLLSTELAASNVASLCEGIPTVQHLHIDARSLTRRSPSKALFTRLAKHSIINGTRELQYLPALRSLTWHQSVDDPWSWTPLLDIFGAPTARSTNHRRQTLESIAITITAYGSGDASVNIDEEILKRILWLRDSVGVKWDLRFKRVVFGKLNNTEVDMIQRAVDRYSLQS